MSYTLVRLKGSNLRNKFRLIHFSKKLKKKSQNKKNGYWLLACCSASRKSGQGPMRTDLPARNYFNGFKKNLEELCHSLKK
jgi:hypothetical protein